MKFNEYSPPESLIGIGHDDKFDIWSLGVIIYYLVVGR